jgi:hypothetical protein
MAEKVDPKLCAECGYKGTPLCTHPDGVYHDGVFLVIPGYDPINPKPYPGDIKPGKYTMPEVQTLILSNQNNPEAQQFIKNG